MAEWLGTALQKLLLRFESARDLCQDAPGNPGRLAFSAKFVAPYRSLPFHVVTPVSLDRMRLLLLLLLTTGSMGMLFAQTAIGHWRDHFQYAHTLAVVQGGSDIYCATNTAVFKYNEQGGETERFTKVHALNDVNIQVLSWSSSRNSLLVGYKNGNLDIMGNGSVSNIPDIKRSSIVGDKGIYCIANQGDLAYLGCGFGIIVVDLQRMEVKDTWLIGPDAAQLQVNGISFQSDSIYAATQQGLYAAWQGAPNLAAYTNWHKRPDIPGPNSAFSTVLSFDGKLMANRRGTGTSKDTIYYYDNGWQVMTSALGDLNRDLTVSLDGQRLTVTQDQRVQQFNTGLQNMYYGDAIGGRPLAPMDAIDHIGGGFWAASDGLGLVRFGNPDEYDIIHPNGPANNSVYRMSSAKGTLVVTTGAPSGNWGSQFLKQGVHTYSNGRWETADRWNDPLFQSGANDLGGGLNDPLAVQVDPEDGAHAFVGSWDDGLVEMHNGHAAGFFGPGNSSLQRFQNSTSNDQATQVGGVAYDSKGNLWVTNSNCSTPISVRQKNGTWHSFSANSTLANNTLLSDVIAASNGYKWIVRPRSSGLFVFDDNGTITESGDDRSIALNTYEGQGKLPSMDVFCVAEDKNNQIWVGTGKGVAVFYNPDAVFSNGNFDAQQILIEQDGNTQILLETESVSAIAVDGADRKWLGTQTSGLYLVSSDGTKQLAHFTAANSPLPSDNIICLNIDAATGEVFIGTDQGIMGYRGDATEGGKTEDCTTVFPNPVRETFTGPVAITGLMRGSDVRITDVAGNLVFHTISLGGEAIWSATDMSGNRVSTGVYMVFTVDPEGTQKCNTKVAVIK